MTGPASPARRPGARQGTTREVPPEGPPQAPTRAPLTPGDAPGAIRIDARALAQMMPMFLWLGADGTIADAGPTLAKITGPEGLIGQNFFTVFQIKRPRGLVDMAGLLGPAGGRLHLRLRDGAQTAFRGLAVPAGNGGALVNLSFGISVADAVRDHALSDADFAPTDLTVELLYLVEAKTAVMAELHDLARRLQQAKSTAEAEALTDTLTGLVNRRGFDQVFADLIRGRRPFGLMHLDLDFFKAVNDTLGHAAGDHVLRQVARRLRGQTRAGDTLARVGGDEFVLLFPGLADPESLDRIGRRIVAHLSEPITYRGRRCQIAASIGLTVSTFYDPPEAARMLADADRALYASKARGRARVTVWAPGRGGTTSPADETEQDREAQAGRTIAEQPSGPSDPSARAHQPVFGSGAMREAHPSDPSARARQPKPSG